MDKDSVHCRKRSRDSSDSLDESSTDEARRETKCQRERERRASHTPTQLESERQHEQQCREQRYASLSPSQLEIEREETWQRAQQFRASRSVDQEKDEEDETEDWMRQHQCIHCNLSNSSHTCNAIIQQIEQVEETDQPNNQNQQEHPILCRLRALINELGDLGHQFKRSFAAISVWADEGDITAIKRECKEAKDSLSKDIGNILKSMDEIAEEIRNLSER